MKLTTYCLHVAVCLLFFVATSTHAAVVTLLPDVINGGDSNTALFFDGKATLTPFVGASQATFNANAARLGIDDQGTNANAFNDPDTDPNNGNEEKLQFQFAADAGLTQIGWDFSRADGASATDGVAITGFASDPGASFSGNTAGFSASYDSGTGTLRFLVPNPPAFSNDDGFLDLVNPSASAGQTLTLSVTDADQAGSQLAITTISYTVIPEPSPVAVLGLFIGPMLAMRRDC